MIARILHGKTKATDAAETGAVECEDALFTTGC